MANGMYPDYTGPTVVNPTPEEQKLATNGKIMRGNVFVLPPKVTKSVNAGGGNTVRIG